MSKDSNSTTVSNSAPGAVVNEQQWNAITQAIAGLNRDQLTWVSGYAAGMAAAQGGAVAPSLQASLDDSSRRIRSSQPGPPIDPPDCPQPLD